MSEGLLIKSIVVPIDEKIVFIMVNKYKFKEDEIKINLLSNEHNQITTTYYLLLKKFIKAGQKTVGDMTSPLFEQYVKDYRNELSFYNNDIVSVINERVYGKKVMVKKRENRKQRKISERKCIKKKVCN
jgi:5'-AMP-activated protein kinase catalytic alpha subunit